MARTGRGGGYGSHVVKHTTAPKVEPRARDIRPGAVNYLGNHVGDHVTGKGSTGWRPEDLIRGAGYNAPVGPTDNVKAVGIGGGRTVMKSGQQDQHGNVAGKPASQGRDILAEFGPERSR